MGDRRRAASKVRPSHQEDFTMIVTCNYLIHKHIHRPVAPFLERHHWFEAKPILQQVAPG
jgi:hypothetical protein